MRPTKASLTISVAVFLGTIFYLPLGRAQTPASGTPESNIVSAPPAIGKTPDNDVNTFAEPSAPVSTTIHIPSSDAGVSESGSSAPATRGSMPVVRSKSRTMDEASRRANESRGSRSQKGTQTSTQGDQDKIQTGRRSSQRDSERDQRTEREKQQALARQAVVIPESAVAAAGRATIAHGATLAKPQNQPVARPEAKPTMALLSMAQQADVYLTQSIRQDLLAHKPAAVRDVMVNTLNGTVYLRGEVGTAADRDLVYGIARGHAEAVPVKNELRIRR